MQVEILLVTWSVFVPHCDATVTVCDSSRTVVHQKILVLVQVMHVSFSSIKLFVRRSLRGQVDFV